MTTRPYFLWDYDLTQQDVQTLLRTGDEETRIWLASRILESARYADVWRYLSLAELRTLFPHLKLKPPVREAWTYALQVWETAASNGRQHLSVTPISTQSTVPPLASCRRLPCTSTVR